jgi:antitoxin (DNA-binding transcriptional repressor) of toxin-antitoxin stability system
MGSMCVNMSNMKTATVRQMQHNLKEVLSWVEKGEEVCVMRRDKVVARLLPATPVAPVAPDFVARARALWGERPASTRLSELVSEGRGER